MQSTPAALLAGGLVVAAQALGGQNRPSPDQPRTALWYARLRKPSFTPPGPAFGAAWTALDGMLGYAGYRLLTAQRGPKRTLAVGAWATNLIGIAGFSYVLFGRKRLDEALGVTVGMVATAGATVAAASRVDRRAAYASAPLLAWVLFASLLQEEVWRRN